MIQDKGYTGYGIQYLGYRIQDTQDTGCTGYTGYRIQDTQDIGCTG